MANTVTNNVIMVDTTGYTRAVTTEIEYIRYIGNTSGTAVVTAGTSGSGGRLYEAAGATNESAEVCISAKDGLHVALTNGAKLYIYLK